MLWDIDHMPPKKWRLDQKRLDQKRQICCSRNKYVILCLKFMCVALIFQGIYVYLHIYSIYWISHPLTNNSTWRASKRDSLLKIYNDIRIYIYNCHPAVLTICMYTPWTHGVSHSLGTCWDFPPKQPGIFSWGSCIRIYLTWIPRKAFRVQRKQPAETGWNHGRFFRWKYGVRFETVGKWQTGSKWAQGLTLFFSIGKNRS